MDCTSYQTQLLKTLASENDVPLSLAAHVDGCPECRAFAEAARNVASIDMTAAPRPELDRQILDVARAEQRRLRNQQPRFVLSGRVVRYAAAACFAIFAVVAVVMVRSAWLASAPQLAAVEPGDAVPNAAEGAELALAWDLDAIDQEILLLDAELATFGSTPVAGTGDMTDDQADERTLDDVLDEIQGVLLFEEETI